MCGYVEKGLSMSTWEKRLAVLTAQGDLIIYKYYLLDIGPGLDFALAVLSNRASISSNERE